MVRRFSVNFAILSMLLDASLTFFALVLAVSLRPELPRTSFIVPIPEVNLPVVLYVLTPFIWVGTFLLFSVYDPKRVYRIIDEFQNVTLATALAALLFAGLLYIAFREFSRWLFVLFVILDLALLLGWRVIVRMVFKISTFPNTLRRVLIVGAGEVGQRTGQMIREYSWTGLELVGYLDDREDCSAAENVLGNVGDARELVQELGIDDVVIALPQHAYGKVNKLVVSLLDLPLNMRVVPDYFSLALYRATVDDFGGLPMINLRDPALNDYQRLVKRLFDLCVGSVLFICLSPLFLLTAVLIKLDSPGPVFFRQQRVGENGRLFDMIKFRSMVANAEFLQAGVVKVNGNGEILHKHPDDPRVTRVGRFLRRTSLDELPQLLNVLKGEMSLVGPRPELPWLVEQYEPWQHKRLAVPQGMTGWWQVNGRSSKPMHLHTEEDLYYIQNYSLWMDLYIIVKTPFVVLRGKGAY